MSNRHKPRVFIACAGLGIANRGFETALRETFDALASEPSLDVTLFKGGGTRGPREVVVPTLSRKNPLSKRVSRLSGRPEHWVEQVLFTLFLLPHVVARQPDVVYFSEDSIGRILWRFRRLTNQQYRLLLRNNGPIAPPFFRVDGVQQVTPQYHSYCLKQGEPAEKQVFLPEAFHIPPVLTPITTAEQTELRRRLGLPIDRPIVISVGALNKGHKRMHYLIREVANLPGPRPFLLLLGQKEAETTEVLQLADRMLGQEHYSARTVAPGEVSGYYRAADLFVLASTFEGFGRVYVEALAHGLPCLAHDIEQTRYIIGDREMLADFTQVGELAKLIASWLGRSLTDSDRIARHRSVYDRFSWDALRPQYVQMFRRFSEGQPLQLTLPASLDPAR